jgi:branched-chain amino acid aminotransferase
MLSSEPYTNGTYHAATSFGQLDASDTKITLTNTPRPVPLPGSAEERSQKVCTDHMASAAWTEAKGWARPEIKPYGPLSLMPTANVFHYATECFEGMKLYRGYDRRLRLFGPLDNCIRMVVSAERISLPIFEPQQLLQMIRTLCEIDGPRWLPKDRQGSFLYIRPAMIGTDSCLGFEVPKEALLFVVISYWPQPANHTPGCGLRLFASQANEVRAWPDGTGYAKIGPNYGPALHAHGRARKAGYDQVLWLYGDDCQITEAASSNVFMLWRLPQGQLQMVTAPLSEGTILAGITRQSVLDLSRERFSLTRKVEIEAHGMQQVEEVEVVERYVNMSEIMAALTEDRLVSVFIVGTAAFVSPVSHINFRGKELQIQTDDIPHVLLLRQWLADVIYGNVRSEWADIIAGPE